MRTQRFIFFRKRLVTFYNNLRGIESMKKLYRFRKLLQVLNIRIFSEEEELFTYNNE
jgi:hypothetical protein